MMIKFISVSELANRYALSTDKIYRDIKRGVLPAVSVAGAIRVREPDARGYAKELNPPARRIDSR